MIRQSFSDAHIERCMSLLDVDPRDCDVVNTFATPRGSALVAHTPLGKVLIKLADLGNQATEQGIVPPRSAGLKNEARYLDALASDDVPRLLHYSENNDLFCLVTSFEDGPNLSSYAEVSETQARFIAREFVKSIGKVHDRGVIHGDVLPDNAIFRNDGNIVVIDLELAHPLGCPGLVPGRANYLSKEAASRILQKEPPCLDQAEETFALTVTCLELITGRFPIDADLGLQSRKHTLQYIAEGGGYSPEGASEMNWALANRLVSVLHSTADNRPQTPQDLGGIIDDLYD